MRVSQPNSGGWNRLNPIAGAQNAWDRIRAHPMQGLMSFIAGIAGGPMAGRAARTGFDMYNDRQFSNAAARLNNATRQQGQQAEADAWSRPSMPELNYTSPWGETSPMTGFSPQYPGQGLPMAQQPWWSTPGVVGGWVAPNGIMDFLGNPDQVITPDGTGVSLPISQQPQAQGAKPDYRAGLQPGQGMNEMGVMGQGANGELFIRGVSPWGGNQRYFRNRRDVGG